MFQNINSLCSKRYFLIASSLPYFELLFNVLGGEEIMAERGSGTELVDVRDNFTLPHLSQAEIKHKKRFRFGNDENYFFPIFFW